MTLKSKSLQRALAALAAAGILAALLGLDLASRGLVWQFAWSVTGEEEPVGQMRGVLQWLASYTRARPRTAPMTPIAHTEVNPYGINTFLQLEVEPDKVERQLQMIAEAGFTWIRQQFEWAEIEVDGRGQFTDSRNDMTGDGVPDTINAWDKYDRIVDLAERYGLQIQARLDNPPAWTHADPAIGSFAPPDDVQDFVNFAVAVAERYRGRIRYYQIWNEPNIYPEWGEQPVNPEGYTDLLCRTYHALKAVDPQIVVISGALAPTIELSGRNLMDLIFLERMYNAGAAGCFDILSVQAYGLFSGPSDRRMRPTTVNIARHQYIRDMMVAHGDAHKPIWISEMAWNYVPGPEAAPDIANRTMFGQVTLEQAARYAPLFYQRAQEEWPWIGVVNYWFFTRPDTSWRSQPQYYFRMVEPDYSAEHPTFTPLPVYDAMRAFITSQTPVLHRGVHQAEHWAVQSDAGAAHIPAEGAQFGQAVQTAAVFFHARGTHVLIRWGGETPPAVRVNGESIPQPVAGAGEGWHSAVVARSTLAQDYAVDLFAAAGADSTFTLDSITVLDRTYQNVAPLAVILLTGGAGLMLALRDILRGRRR